MTVLLQLAESSDNPSSAAPPPPPTYYTLSVRLFLAAHRLAFPFLPSDPSRPFLALSVFLRPFLSLGHKFVRRRQRRRRRKSHNYIGRTTPFPSRSAADTRCAARGVRSREKSGQFLLLFSGRKGENDISERIHYRFPPIGSRSHTKTVIYYV